MPDIPFPGQYTVFRYRTLLAVSRKGYSRTLFSSNPVADANVSIAPLLPPPLPSICFLLLDEPNRVCDLDMIYFTTLLYVLAILTHLCRIPPKKL